MWKSPKQWIFKERGGKEKNTSWNWKRGRVEGVKEMLYLGIKMQRNDDLTNHIKESNKKANVIMK